MSQEQMPLTPKEKAMERLGWLTPEAIKTFGVKGAFDLAFTEDVDVVWTKKYTIKSIKGISPLGKAFVMVHGGAKAMKGLTESEFESLDGKSGLCTIETLPPDKSLDDPDWALKPEHEARLHPYWKGMKVNPFHGFIDDGQYLRPIFDRHLVSDYAHLPREEDVSVDIRVGLSDGRVATLDPVSQLGMHIINVLNGKIRELDGTPQPLIGMKFKGGFENWAAWSWKGRLQTIEL